MNALDQAIAAAREALRNSHATANERPHWLTLESAMSDLLAALDAARGEAVAWVHTWHYPGADSLTESFSCKPADEFLRDTVPAPSSIVSSVPLYAAPPAALAVPPTSGPDGGFGWFGKAPPAAAVRAANVTPMRQPRADLARLVESINAAVYANGDGLSVTEAIGALELAKLELLKEQEQ